MGTEEGPKLSHGKCAFHRPHRHCYSDREIPIAAKQILPHLGSAPRKS